MNEFSNAQWAVQFSNTTTGQAFAALGTTVTPIEILGDAIAAYNKAESVFNQNQSGPPYLNSVSDPSTGTIIFGADGAPLQPVSYQVSLVRSFGNPKTMPRTSPTTTI
jgi:hypothetical protein